MFAGVVFARKLSRMLSFYHVHIFSVENASTHRWLVEVSVLFADILSSPRKFIGLLS
jgi:hypothetical protein